MYCEPKQCVKEQCYINLLWIFNFDIMLYKGKILITGGYEKACECKYSKDHRDRE